MIKKDDLGLKKSVWLKCCVQKNSIYSLCTIKLKNNYKKSVII